MNLFILAREVIRPLFRLLFRYEASVPSLDQPMVVVANHFSLIDPAPLALALEYPLDFMAKVEIFRIPVLAHFLRSCGVFPVQRGGGGRPAIEAAIQRAKTGRTIAMFPEGTRSRDGRLQTAKIGAALIAMGAEVPILPVAIQGTFEVLPRGHFLPHFFRRIRVRAADPIDPAPFLGQPDGAEQLTRCYWEAIRRLLEE